MSWNLDDGETNYGQLNHARKLGRIAERLADISLPEAGPEPENKVAPMIPATQVELRDQCVRCIATQTERIREIASDVQQVIDGERALAKKVQESAITIRVAERLRNEAKTELAETADLLAARTETLGKQRTALAEARKQLKAAKK